MLEGISTRENQIDDAGIDAPLRAAHQVQHGLQFVREVSRRIEMQKTSAPLEGMKRTEDRMDRLGVGRIRLQHQDALLDGLEQLQRLGMELAEQFKVFLQV